MVFIAKVVVMKKVYSTKWLFFISWTI